MDADEIAQRIALLFDRQPDMSGKQINRLHGERRRMVEDLAAEIATENARLREALEGMVESLRPGEHVPFIDPVHGAVVEALGRRIGFGALMSSASASWAKVAEERGHPAGGEFVAGPCRAVLQSDLRKARAALAPQDPA